MTAAAPQDRLAWLDQVRAAGIFLVVVGHAIRSAERSGLDVSGVLDFADQAIYSFHMPLFFLLAGMTQRLGGRKRTAAALDGLLWTIVLPYLLWSEVWLLLKSGFSAEANQPAAVSPLEILWQPVDHFWFLYVLLLIRLPWIAVEASGSALLRHLAVLVPLAVAFVGAGPAEGIFNPFLAFWAAFYGLGTLAIDGLAGLSRGRLAVAAAAAGGIWLALLTGLPDLQTSGFGIARTVAALGGAFALIGLVMLAAPGGLFGRLVGFVGEASLAIFLTHTLFGAAVRAALGHAGWLTPWTLVVAATMVGLIAPALLHAAVLRIGLMLDLPIGRWVGFGAQRRSHYLDLAPPRRAAATPSGGRAG